MLHRRTGHDDPIRVGAAFPLDPGERVRCRVLAYTTIEPAPPPLIDVTVPGGTVLRTEHGGDAALVPFAYRAVLAEAARRGLAVDDVVYEDYDTDPGGTLRTTVTVGVRPA